MKQIRFPFSERTNVAGFQLHVVGVDTQFDVYLIRDDDDYSVLLARAETADTAKVIAFVTLRKLATALQNGVAD